jgi:hypothetical protein
MTEPNPERRPHVGQNVTPSGSALMTAAFCMVCFAGIVWPLGRAWKQTPRDWEMILPMVGLEVFLAGLAILAIIRYAILSRRAGYSMVTPGKPVQRFNVNRIEQLGVEATDLTAPFLAATAIPAPARPDHDQVDLALDAPAAEELEPAEVETAFVYPDVPDALGEEFQRIMAIVRALPEHPDVLADLNRRYLAAADGNAGLAFRQAEAFVIRKVEKRQDFNPDAYAEPVDPANPALHLDLADQIHPYAATAAAMVLLSTELPERLWDLLAAPWEAAGLDFPQVVLAG